MRAEDQSKEPAETAPGKGAPPSMKVLVLRGFLLLALVVTKGCLFQTGMPEAEPASESPEKLLQQAALESLLREGSKSEIQAAPMSQAKSDFDAENVNLEISGEVVTQVVLIDVEAKLFLKGYQSEVRLLF